MVYILAQYLILLKNLDSTYCVVENIQEELYNG